MDIEKLNKIKEEDWRPLGEIRAAHALLQAGLIVDDAIEMMAHFMSRSEAAGYIKKVTKKRPGRPVGTKKENNRVKRTITFTQAHDKFIADKGVSRSRIVEAALELLMKVEK